MSWKVNRRALLQSAGAATLCTSVPGSVLAVSLTVPSTAQSTGFNGGRSQVNVNALQWGGAYPFINLLKTAQTWGLNDASAFPSPDTLDTDGYPAKITNGGVYTVFDVPSQASRPGNYVITWNGNGTISLGMSHLRISGGLTSKNGIGRYVFATTASNFLLRIVAVGNPHITNLQIFHVDDEAALNAGQVFGVRFKQRLKEARFGVIRFLAWQNGNTSNVTTWATRKPLTYFSYASQELRPSLYAGVTANIGSTYSANLPGFRLADKATIIVMFNVSSNGPCTLNVNGTGAVNILSENSEPLGKYSYPVGGSWQSLATLVYDETLNAWIKHGGDLALGGMGLNNGCPPEVMVQLCAEVGAHPYFVTPHLSIDPATDYMPNLAEYCRDNGPAWMVPRFEGPNETWNSAAGFFQTRYAWAKAKTYGWGPDVHNWYGKVMSVLGQAINSAYGGDRARFQVLCGVQTSLGANPSGTTVCHARLASTKYLAQLAAPQATYTKTPAADWVTHVCCTQYFAPSEYSTAQETVDAGSFAAATGNAILQISIATTYANTANSGDGAFTLAKCATMYANWKAWALSFKISRMCGYEGGYSPDYTGGGKTPVDQLRAASKNAPSLYDFTIMNYNNFVGLSDKRFVAEFPSCFQLSGRTSSERIWSVLEDVYASNPPQWNAIVAFNR